MITIVSELETFSVKKKLLEGYMRTREKRTGIHVSDITHCKRRVAYERLDLNPPTIDERKLKFFIRGEIKHLRLQEILGPGSIAL